MPKSSDQIFIFLASVIIVERIFRVFFLRIFSMNNCVGEKIKTNQVLFFGAFIASFYKALFQVNQSFLSFRCLGENCSDNSDFYIYCRLTKDGRVLGGLAGGGRSPWTTPSSSALILVTTVSTILRPATQSRVLVQFLKATGFNLHVKHCCHRQRWFFKRPFHTCTNWVNQLVCLGAALKQSWGAGVLVGRHGLLLDVDLDVLVSLGLHHRLARTWFWMLQSSSSVQPVLALDFTLAR